eukprot:g12663.t1
MKAGILSLLILSTGLLCVCSCSCRGTKSISSLQDDVMNDEEAEEEAKVALEVFDHDKDLSLNKAELVAPRENGLEGTVRFLGATYFASGPWIGIDLDAAEGKNDGTVQGYRYFSCQADHGLHLCAALRRDVAPQGARGAQEGAPGAPAAFGEDGAVHATTAARAKGGVRQEKAKRKVVRRKVQRTGRGPPTRACEDHKVEETAVVEEGIVRVAEPAEPRFQEPAEKVCQGFSQTEPLSFDDWMWKTPEKIVEVETEEARAKDPRAKRVEKFTPQKIVEVPVMVERIVEVEKEVIKEVPVERIIEKEVIKEVPVERIIEKEVIKEIPVETIVEKEVVQEVVRQVPVDRVVERRVEVIKEVPVEKIVEKEVEVPEKIVEVEKEVMTFVPVDKIVEKEVIKEVPVDRVVEKIVEIEKEVIKEVEKIVEVPVEKIP